MTTLNLKVRKAAELAAFKHRRQTRKHGEGPYMDHVNSVVAILQQHGYIAEDMLAAAYLHDVVEETDTSVGEIYNQFGTEVAKFVYWLTDDHRGNRTIRNAIAAWRLSRAPLEAKLIKLADVIDNALKIFAHDPQIAPEFMLEKRQILWAMADEEGDRITRLPIFREALRTINTETQRKAG